MALVWVFDPFSKRVTVHQPGSFHSLGAADALTGGEVLPGFSAPLSAVFG